MIQLSIFWGVCRVTRELSFSVLGRKLWFQPEGLLGRRSLALSEGG